MQTYKQNNIYKTDTTTGDHSRHLFGIGGPQSKPPHLRPYLTTLAACKRYIDARALLPNPHLTQDVS